MRPLIGISIGQLPAAREAPHRFCCDSSYPRAVFAAGGAPVLLAPLSEPESVATLVSSLDGFLLSGGGDVEPARYGAPNHLTQFGLEPERDAFEIALARESLKSGKPLLGICRGCQVLAVAFGGTLWQDLPSEKPSSVTHKPSPGLSSVRHRIGLAEGSILAEILGAGEVEVNSSHHQAPRQLSGELAATAWSEDDVIEGVELAGAGFLVGVQWHPERTHEEQPSELRLFNRLVEEAAKTKQR